MRVVVTQDDIDQGVRGDCGYCPVARAVRRTTGSNDVVVTNAWVNVSDNKDELVRSWHSSPTVQRFIAHFDAEEPVLPFSFELDLEPQ